MNHGAPTMAGQPKAMLAALLPDIWRVTASTRSSSFFDSFGMMGSNSSVLARQWHN
jgi:hypothetical protein